MTRWSGGVKALFAAFVAVGGFTVAASVFFIVSPHRPQVEFFTVAGGQAVFVALALALLRWGHPR